MIKHRDLDGLSGSVLHLAFSPDGRFLSAAGANCHLYIWDVTTGEVVYSRKTEGVCHLVVWGDMLEASAESRYPSYILCSAFESEVTVISIIRSFHIP